MEEETNESLLELKRMGMFDPESFRVVNRALDKFAKHESQPCPIFETQSECVANLAQDTFNFLKQTQVMTNEFIRSLGDICVAFTHNHSIPLRIELNCCYETINVIEKLAPNTLEWVFNGTPLLFVCLHYHGVKMCLYDLTTNERVYNVEVTFYYALLLQPHRHQLALMSNASNGGVQFMNPDNTYGLYWGSMMSTHKSNLARRACFFPRKSFCDQREEKCFLEKVSAQFPNQKLDSVSDFLNDHSLLSQLNKTMLAKEESKLELKLFLLLVYTWDTESLRNHSGKSIQDLKLSFRAQSRWRTAGQLSFSLPRDIIRSVCEEWFTFTSLRKH